jgi:peroxiredoxin
MGAAILALRLVLAGVFLIAGAAKLADLAGSRRAVAGFGVPQRMVGVAGVGLPVAELAVAGALLVSESVRFGALGALLLLVVFVVGIAVVLRRGTEADCHCFGQLHSAPIGWRTLVRNVVLAAAAAFVVLAGWHDPGISATAWVAGLSAGWGAALGLGLLLVLVLAFSAWFSLQLLSQNGRIFARLEAIEAAIGGSAETLEPGGELGAALGAGLGAGGLPVGSPAPGFTLPSTDGDRHALGPLLASGVPLLLVFSDAGCGPCDALLPDVARWQLEYAQQLVVAVIASGDPDRNRAKAERHELARVLLQSEREVSDSYQAHGTPMAVVIGADGLIQSPTVGGADAIRMLVMQATAPPVAVVQVPAPSDGNGSDGAAAPGASRVGRPAPDLVLVDLDGQRIALRDLYAERTLALFWNPGCGFCQRMLADLKAFERDPPTDAPRLLVISSGDPDHAREHDLSSLVLVDPEGQAMDAFEAQGTPMGVLIEHGRIASPVAVGADAVLELAAGSPALELVHAGPARTGDPPPNEGNHNGSRR